MNTLLLFIKAIVLSTFTVLMLILFMLIMELSVKALGILAVVIGMAILLLTPIFYLILEFNK